MRGQATKPGRQNGQRWTMTCAAELTPTWTGPPSSLFTGPLSVYTCVHVRSVARHKPFQARHQFPGLARGPDSSLGGAGHIEVTTPDTTRRLQNPTDQTKSSNHQRWIGWCLLITSVRAAGGGHRGDGRGSEARTRAQPRCAANSNRTRQKQK
jgi:hypothetical protein